LPASGLRQGRGAGQRLCHHRLRPHGQGPESLPPATEERKMKKPSRIQRTGKAKKQRLPPGWDEKRVKEVIDYYENQTEEEQLAEHEAACATRGQSVMVVPTELVPETRKLIAKRRGA